MITEIPKEPLDPAIAAIDARWKESGIPGLYVGGNGPVSRERADNIRALLYPKPKLPTGRIERRVIAGPGGELAIRVIWPHQAGSTSAAPIGTLVYFHGGGWVVGSLDSHEAHAIRLANRAGVVVVNVDYRLAPEHPFPAAVDDAMASVKWAHAHLAELGGAGKPLAVGGDSAGGNLAAVMAVMCRDSGLALKAQLLIYPATDLTGTGDPDIRKAYFGSRFDTLSRDPRASPLLAPSLTGVAPAIIGVGSHDFLYQDNMVYARALQKARVPLLLRQWGNLNHGFFSFVAISKPSEAAADQLCDDLRALLLG